MKHIVIRLESPKQPRSFELTLCDAYNPVDENALLAILKDGGGIVEVRREICEKPKVQTVWKA